MEILAQGERGLRFDGAFNFRVSHFGYNLFSVLCGRGDGSGVDSMHWSFRCNIYGVSWW
jgi:hypothetical protein